MPTAPRQHRPPGWKPTAERKREADKRRGTAQERGYTAQWSNHAAQLKEERIFCELCKEIGKYTPIIGKGKGVCDHIIPVDGDTDPLFWEPTAVWVICVACDRWKSINFDGSYGARKIVATDRSLSGVAKRRVEIVERFKAVQKETPGAG